MRTALYLDERSSEAMSHSMKTVWHTLLSLWNDTCPTAMSPVFFIRCALEKLRIYETMLVWANLEVICGGIYDREVIAFVA